MNQTSYRVFDQDHVHELGTAAERFLGGDVRARARPLHGPIPRLPPEEARAVERAVEKRRREFAVGRALARELLAEVGRPVVSLPRSTNRAPQWPANAWGSITHTSEVALVAVADSRTRTFGIDLEGSEPLREDIIGYVLRPEERIRLQGENIPLLSKIAFSAKEAFYKAQHAHTGVLLDFLDVSLEMDPTRGRFEVSVHHEAATRLPEPHPVGHWTVVGPFVLTALRFERASR